MERQAFNAGGVFQEDGQQLEAVFLQVPCQELTGRLPKAQLADAYLDGDLPARGHAHQLAVVG